MMPSDIALTIVLTTLIILLLIAGITISFFVISRQRNIQKIELAEAHLAYQKELRKVEGEISEQLMRQFAQELHDNVGHILTCLRLEMENLKLDDKILGQRLQKADTFLTDASNQIKLLSRSLNSDYLSQISLKSAIDLEIQKQKGLNKFIIHWQSTPEIDDLKKDQELMVFRIFQEILNNAIRYSLAQNLYISIKKPFLFTIKDDGIGFDLEKMVKSDSMSGLKNIMARSQLAGLICTIKTGERKGCEYIIALNDNP